ncbi:MAG: glycosyltransferase family 39 protein [Verrucomicrobiota bacterium]
MPDEEVVDKPRKELNAAVIIRRSLYLIMMIWLLWFYLGLDFRGLNTPQGIDQAQVAREIARGNGFETKMVRPLALYQLNHSKESEEEWVSMAGLQDTYNAPLNPLVNSWALRMVKGSWEYDPEKPLYFPDVVIAGVSVFLFMASVGVSYLLVSRIFDTRIAAVTVALMLLCELLWNFAQSGLPQMLMLFLFTFSLYFLYKATENAEAKKSPYLWIALCGGFMGLLALSHWLTVWLFMGMFIFVAIFFKPRGVTAFLLLAVFLVIVAPWLIRNVTVSGTPVGSSVYAIYNGLAAAGEDFAMRNYDPDTNPLSLEGMRMRLIITSLAQVVTIYASLGAIAAAPLFFLALLHPFRRAEIALFRWGILFMWVMAVVGMALFARPEEEVDFNQLHILFIPLMTAYGLAFLSVIWTRMGLPTQYQLVRNGHFIIVLAISAAPLLLKMPGDTLFNLRVKGMSSWPPYIPSYIAKLGDWTEENEVTVADMPWAVAWYADRVSLWLPATREQYDELARYGARRDTPFAGIYFTPISIDQPLSTGIMTGEYDAWSDMILYGRMRMLGVPMQTTDFPFPVGVPMPVKGQTYLFTDSASRIRFD